MAAYIRPQLVPAGLKNCESRTSLLLLCLMLTVHVRVQVIAGKNCSEVCTGLLRAYIVM